MNPASVLMMIVMILLVAFGLYLIHLNKKNKKSSVDILELERFLFSQGFHVHTANLSGIEYKKETVSVTFLSQEDYILVSNWDDCRMLYNWTPDSLLKIIAELN